MMPSLHIKRYLITVVLTFVPLWLTWLVFKFIFTFVSHVGEPVVAGLFLGLSQAFPGAAAWLSQEWFQSIIAFIGTVIAFYLVGIATSRVFGQRLLTAFENMIGLNPMVQTIYGGSKKLMTMLSTKPAGAPSAWC